MIERVNHAGDHNPAPADHRAARLPATADVSFPRSATPAVPTIVAGDGVILTDDRGRTLTYTLHLWR